MTRVSSRYHERYFDKHKDLRGDVQKPSQVRCVEWMYWKGLENTCICTCLSWVYIAMIPDPGQLEKEKVYFTHISR